MSGRPCIAVRFITSSSPSPSRTRRRRHRRRRRRRFPRGSGRLGLAAAQLDLLTSGCPPPPVANSAPTTSIPSTRHAQLSRPLSCLPRPSRTLFSRSSFAPHFLPTRLSSKTRLPSSTLRNFRLLPTHSRLPICACAGAFHRQGRSEGLILMGFG